MSAIPTGQAGPFHHHYDEIRRRIGPAGAVCPHCQGSREIYYSSAQLRRPVYKRAVFAYLRCHNCTHRFRYLRLAPLIFWMAAAMAGLLAGMIG